MSAGKAWPRGLEWAAAAVLGGMFNLPFVYTAAWWLAPVCLAGLVWSAAKVPPARAAALGLAFGTAWLLGGTWWLFISLHRYGGLPAPLAVTAVTALSLALSLYLALALALFARWRRGLVAADALLFAALWLGAELARGLLFTGFPWVASGYGQIDGPLAALAPWLGVYGIGFVLALAAALVGLGPRRIKTLVLALALFGLAPLAARDFSRDAGALSVTLLQTNVAQDEKFAADRMPEALGWLHQALRAARGDLVVAPETAIPLLPDQFGSAAQAEFMAPFLSGERAALVGRPLGSFEAGYTNSVTGWSAAAEYRYDKHHLVPFGEFIPPGFRWFVDLMNIPLGDFSRGPLDAPSFAFRDQRIGPNICYEDLFGEELARRFVDPESAPTLLANVSNIGWFGDTIAVDQHLQISRFRTLELQRPMLRATNTGATAVIDHRGRVTASLPPFTRGALEASVEGRSGVTPYAWWAGRAGLWPLILLVVGVAGASTVARRRRTWA